MSKNPPALTIGAAAVTMTSREIAVFTSADFSADLTDGAGVTQEVLRAMVSYDPATGIFRRLVSTSSQAMRGDIAGSLRVSKSGKAYLGFKVLGQHECAHRWAFLYMTGAMPPQVDHENGNGCDNRWANLKAATNTINCQNQRLRSSNTSGHLGISWHKKSQQWSVRINANGRRIALGYRKSLDDAVKLRKAAESRYGYSPAHGLERPLFTPPEVADEWAKHQLAQRGGV